jgi:hypothetical protein
MMPRSDLMSYDLSESLKIANWRVFFQQNYFEKPETFEDGQTKAFQNFKTFRSNYLFIVIGFIFLAILTNMRATIFLLLGAASAFAYVKDIKGVSSIVRAKKKAVYIAIGVYSVITVFFTNALQLFCIGLVGGGLFCLFHAIMYVPPPFSTNPDES